MRACEGSDCGECDACRERLSQTAQSMALMNASRHLSEAGEHVMSERAHAAFDEAAAILLDAAIDVSPQKKVVG